LKILICITTLILSSIHFKNLYSQPINVDCHTSIEIQSPDKYCSEISQFNNIFTDSNAYPIPNCWNEADNDVWFHFKAFARSCSITIIGLNSGGGGLSNPKVALYFVEACNKEIVEMACGIDGSGFDIITIDMDELIIGQNYYIRVDGKDDNQGSFKLCINNYNPQPQPGQDCSDATILCDKSSFIVHSVNNSGANNDETNNTCISSFLGGNSETQSSWFKWTCSKSGSLSFVIDPIRQTTVGEPGDDLDFVLYELPDGKENCNTKNAIRCCATHPFSFGISGNAVLSCNYQTGLNLNSIDTEEFLGCTTGDDGFVKYIEMKEGESYALFVNNYSKSGQGFELSFGGTGEFSGLKPQLNLLPPNGLRCETLFQIEEINENSNNLINNWEWSFGVGSSPTFSLEKAPPLVTYETHGTKFISLTINSGNGCLVTILDSIHVEPCCGDNSELILTAAKNDPFCFGETSGSIVMSSTGGFYPHEYSFEDFGYNNILFYNNLPSGSYNLKVKDSIGCIDSINVNINSPDSISVDAGPDKFLSLGNEVQLHASYKPNTGNEKIEWIVNEGLTCNNCLDPIAYPVKTTTYFLEITNNIGCSKTDSITIQVAAKKNRPIFLPNILNLSDTSINGKFIIGAEPSVETIKNIAIFDRWGNLIWNKKDLDPFNSEMAWNGTMNNIKVEPGVYFWQAQIQFIDGIIMKYVGDVTVIN